MAALRTNYFNDPTFEFALANLTATNATAAQSTVAGVTSGTQSLAVTPSNTNNASYADMSRTLAASNLTAGNTYTLSADCTLTAPLAGTLNASSRTLTAYISTDGGASYTGYSSAAAPNAAGTTRLSVTFTAPANVTHFIFRFFNGATSGNGATYWDSLQLEDGSTPTAFFDGDSADAAGNTHVWRANGSSQEYAGKSGRTNLTTTPSFELGVWSTGGNATLAQSTTGVFAGTYSMAITPSGANNDSYAAPDAETAGKMHLGLQPGCQYTISGYVTLTAPQAGTLNARARTISLFASSNNGSTFTEYNSTQAPNTAGTYRVSLTLTIPAATNELLFRLYNGATSGNGTVYWDGLLVERTSTVKAYFDGSTTTSGVTNTWLGPAQGSESLALAATTMVSSGLSGSGSLTSSLAYQKRISSTLSGSGSLTSLLKKIMSPLSGSGTLTSSLRRNISTTLSGSGTLTSVTGHGRINSGLSGSGSLVSRLYRNISSGLTGNGSLTSSLAYRKRISSALSGSGALTSALRYQKRIAANFYGLGFLSSALQYRTHLTSVLSAEGVLYSELGYVVKPAELGTAPLGKLVSFNVSTSAVPLDPAEGAGAAPSVSAGYTKGINPEFVLGETNTLSHGAVGTYSGEVVRLSLPEGSDVANLSQDTSLTLLNTNLNLYPFIDAAPSTWTAARAIDYWTQQCGLFYDAVPGDCVAYASGFGHTDSYGADTIGRFYEKLTGGATTTVLLGNRSVKSLGSAVTGTTSFHNSPNAILPPAPGQATTSRRLMALPWSQASIITKGSGVAAIDPPSIAVPVSVPRNRKLVASVGLGLLGTGRTATVTWNLMDTQQVMHNVVIMATSEGSITASFGGVPVQSTTVPAGANYRAAFSIERVSATAVVTKLSVHTDNLDGTGTQVYASATSAFQHALPAVLYLTSLTHVSAGGSGAEMLRWGTYLTIAAGHPLAVPAIQKALSQTGKNFGFVSGFEGNVWAMLNEYCAITRQDVSFLNSQLTVAPRITSLTAPASTFAKFSRDSQRRDKYKQVAVVNKQSVAVSTNDAVLWRADSVFQVAAREVFETTVQTPHSILSLVQPAPVSGILPFPYKQGGGQYVVTGADGYIVAPQWWIDNGGKVEVSLTGKAGEIGIKITAPQIDTPRAPYRISEGAGDRPALYIAGSGILNKPKEVHVGTGAKPAKEGFDKVFDSPFVAGPMETYDTAAAMAAVYSCSVADAQFELPNDFYTPSRFGQFPAGTRFTDGKRTYRIKSASQTHNRVSGNAIPQTTIGDYVASYPAGSTIADEKARHTGRTIKQFNLSPLRSSN